MGGLWLVLAPNDVLDMPHSVFQTGPNFTSFLQGFRYQSNQSYTGANKLPATMEKPTASVATVVVKKYFIHCNVFKDTMIQQCYKVKPLVQLLVGEGGAKLCIILQK